MVPFEGWVLDDIKVVGFIDAIAHTTAMAEMHSASLDICYFLIILVHAQLVAIRAAMSALIAAIGNTALERCRL